MIKLYFRSAINNLLKKGNSSAISIMGLIIAFTAVFHIYSIIDFERGYDSQHKKINRIYRISGDIIAAENTMTHAVLGPLMGPGLKNDFPAVESYTRLVPVRHAVKLEADGEVFQVEEAYTADTSVFNIFTFHFIYGSPTTSLGNPDEIVINESLSDKMFGSENPIGKIVIRDGTPLTVAGVITDSPENSHHKLNVLFSMGTQWTNLDGISDIKISEAYWMPSCYVFILLQKNSTIESITDNFQPFYNKYMSTFGKVINAQFAPVAVPLKELHFSRSMSYDYPKGNRTYSYLFAAIGLFIVLIAFFNYSNLLVSQNVVESKNIGIRKINGANQYGIYLQFFINSLVLTSVALLFAVLLYKVSIPFINEIPLVHSKNLSVRIIAFLVLSILLVFSFTSSLIPFFSQAKKNGLTLIQKKNESKLNSGQLSFGRISTIAQLSLSIMLLIAVILIGKQLSDLVETDMGFDEENVVLLQLNKTMCKPEVVGSLKEEFLRNPNVESVAFSRYAPGEVLGSIHFQIERDGKKITKIVNGMEIDYDYIPLMKMELAEGRNFDPTFNDDNNRSAIINEAAIQFCGFTPPVVGKEIEGVKVVGVLKDVCFNSLHNQTEPLFLYLSEQKEGYLNIRLKAKADLKASIENLQSSWKTFFVDEPFKMHFLDNRIKMMYDDDYAKSKLIMLFTLITIVISLMGLFNISLLKCNQRIKEIGIRKVNGAKVSEILTMLNKDFVKWVAIAFVVACPIAYYAMSKWLENFAYKTELSWWIFALSGILALGIALLTVSYQSYKAATRNPVEALRYE